MDEKDLRSLAVDTVIKYAAQQGIKLRRLDFKESSLETFVVVNRNSDNGEIKNIYIGISYTGRWKNEIKKKKDNFLNYVNARLEKDYLTFTFSKTELEIIASGGSSHTEQFENIDRIIEKINKLLALADQSKNDSEQEAIAASLQAQKLLAKYNLSLTDVRGERPEEEVEQSVADIGLGKKWKYSLATVIANNFACKCFVVGNEQVVFYGYKADILAARRTFMYLFKVGDKLANQVAKRYREKYGYADGIYNSFCAGFIKGIGSELEKQCKALAIIVQPKVEESFKDFSAGFGRTNAKINYNNADAFSEGKLEGKRALNAQYIEGKNEQPA